MYDVFVQAAIECIERGWVPDRWLRRAVRHLSKRRLASLQSNDASEQEKQLQGLVEAMRQSVVAPVPERANEQHYELPASFFGEFLGPRRKYSSCYWPEGVESLERAEEEALAETCQHAEVADGQEILELGCGWGSLTLWLAEHYPTARVTAVSNSRPQREYIEDRLRAAGWSRRVRVITADMNDFVPESNAGFDRVVSVEMFEHMRNYRLLLQRIAGWLRNDGKLFVHIFCHRQYAYAFQSEGASNWMGRYFFTGGLMPSRDLLSRFHDHLEIEQSWCWDGTHYQRTLEAWLERLDARQDRVMPILSQVYGAHDARRWLQRWRMFLLGSAEVFGYQQGREWGVGHYLLNPVSRRAKAGLLELAPVAEG